jgi:hypothetical protein
MQEYLKNNQITSNQAEVVFCFRTRLAKYSTNFIGGKPTKMCPVCETNQILRCTAYSARF